MGAIEEVRSLLQDVVAPDLKSLKTRVEALEKRVEQGFADANRRFAEMNATIDDRFAEVERRAEGRHTELMNYLSLDARIRRLEGERRTEHQ